MVYFIQCTCGTKIYKGSDILSRCPSCQKDIVIINGMALQYSRDFGDGTNVNGTPLLILKKFQPTELHYFNAEFPEIDKKIYMIWTDLKVSFDLKWESVVNELAEFSFSLPNFSMYAWMYKD